VVAQERLPALPARRRRIPTIAHVPLHGALRDVDSELEQLAANALGAPEPILGGHAADQLDELGRHPRSRRLRRPRLPTPQQTKAFAVPAKHRLGLHEQQRVAPPRQHGREQRDQAALMWLENWSLHLPCCNDKLLAQQDVLGRQLHMRAQQVSGEAANDRATPRPQRFVNSSRRGTESPPQLANGMSEHEPDLLRGRPQLQPLVVGEIFNDPRAEERSSQDSPKVAQVRSRVAPSNPFEKLSREHVDELVSVLGPNGAGLIVLDDLCSTKVLTFRISTPASPSMSCLPKLNSMSE
jgi:hypothetical protein